MEIYEIKCCDCSTIKNRIKLVKSVMEAINADERPTEEKLSKICKSLRSKYGIAIRKFKQKDGKLHVSFEIERGTYSSFVCLSYYELMCKYILFVKAIRDYKNMEAK